MAIKAVDLTRKIRDKHYEQTKNLSIDEQIFFFNEKARRLQERLKDSESINMKDKS